MKENWKGAFVAGAGFFIAFTVLDYITYGETGFEIALLGGVGLIYHIFHCEIKKKAKRKRKNTKGKH